jgi:hypothetical protein
MKGCMTPPTNGIGEKQPYRTAYYNPREKESINFIMLYEWEGVQEQ